MHKEQELEYKPRIKNKIIHTTKIKLKYKKKKNKILLIKQQKYQIKLLNK
jgi:hypothetical protein